MNGLIRFLLFGNYFYGFCVVALSMEANLQQKVTLNSTLYYFFVFVSTVLYYTHAYIAEPDGGSANKRSVWYAKRREFIRGSQIFLTVTFFLTGFYLFRENLEGVLKLTAIQWVIIAVFPVVAALYYGSVKTLGLKYNLRSNGWLKPFVIGFVWAGAVTVYPVMFAGIEQGQSFEPGLLSFLLFIKNFMFITMLCIMFDIKDYAADSNQQLKTFVVRYGLRKTIFYILIPLTLIGLGTFLSYALLMHFPLLRILVNTVPFILLIIVAYSMHRRKSILYYLAIIDGLMLVKAVCGIIGITLIK